MQKSISIIIEVLLLALLHITPALAHVLVKPAEVGVAAYQTFTIGVPNEKDNPTVALRLVLPEGLKSVTPNVKPGWTVTAQNNEINWTGGSIPTGQRDDFIFSAQAPASETTLQWKVYQTYQNGEVIAWDHDPSMEHSDKEGSAGPYSQTKVINDLKASPSPTATNFRTSQTLSVTALALSLVALALGIRRKSHA